MKANGPFKILALLFVTVLAFYLIAYHTIEGRRNRNGPWIVAFTNDLSGAPALRIDHPALAITNVQLVFPDAMLPTNFTAKTILFQRPRPVPFPLPMGECIFMDTTFLPGSVVMRMSGHEVQLIPRVLTINGREQPWKSGETIALTAILTNAISPRLNGR
ncbi:MAG: hypothetical protein H7Y43_15535 [Akkermansiaceae bacterium]|nr:hypothetical protein [Verrucomicrobiales bacterium]